MVKKLIGALDIGTNKIFGLCGICQGESIEVLGAEAYPTPEEGVKQGRIVDIEAVSDTIYNTISEINKQSGERLEWVTTGIGGGHLKGLLHSKSISIDPEGREISDADIRSLRKELNASISGGNVLSRKVLEILPQEYVIDSQTVTRKDPVGMHGNSLEMKVHAVTVEVNPLKDLLHVIKEANLHAEFVYPHSWAAAEAVLSEEEKKLGCTLIDMGGGTTDTVFFRDAATHMTDSFKIGGGNIDKDLSILLHTPLSYAEELKIKYARCDIAALVKEKNPILSESVDVSSASGRNRRKSNVEEVSRIVHARVREILEDFVRQRGARSAFFHNAGAGVVLTGGCARLKGMAELCEQVFELPARVALPKRLTNLDKNFYSPEYAAGVGLLILASKRERKEKKENLLARLKRQARKWF